MTAGCRVDLNMCARYTLSTFMLVVTVTASALAQGAPAPLSPDQECALRAGDTFKECDNCPEMVVIPAGTFTMGSPAGEVGRYNDEDPQHKVTLPRPIAIG